MAVELYGDSIKTDTNSIVLKGTRSCGANPFHCAADRVKAEIQDHAISARITSEMGIKYTNIYH